MTKKHIVIDARLYGPKHTGIGRYTKNVLLSLTHQPDFSHYRFSLLVYHELLSDIKTDLGNSFNYIPTNIRHYSFKEQLLLPLVISKLKPDLVHFTHFNKPLLYFGRSVVTIHDLIKHFFRGKANTTKNSLLYWPKYFFYILITHITIKTNTIIVPSDFWRQYIIKHFHLSPAKITTTHEAVDPDFKKNLSQVNPKSKPVGDYLLYTGNLYPHKNIKVIIQALRSLPKLKLKIISARSFFTHQVEAEAKQNQVSNQIEFLGYIPDSQFKRIYSQAIALVHPSFMEGFSLTGLEAMALGCPVISSNSSCLPEIYQDSVLYFDPYKPSQLVKQITRLLKTPNLRRQLIQKGCLQINKYSWDNTAKKTLSVYQKTLNDR